MTEVGDLSAYIRTVADFPTPGISFKDITPLLADPDAFAATVQALAAGHGPGEIDAVVGVEARGFILAAPVALALRAGFVPVRKQGKLPSAAFSTAYALEYGEAVLEVHEDAVRPGQKVLIIDDVLATGGTVAATIDLVQRSGGTVAAVSVLLEIPGLGGRERLGDVPVTALLTA